MDPGCRWRSIRATLACLDQNWIIQPMTDAHEIKVSENVLFWLTGFSKVREPDVFIAAEWLVSLFTRAATLPRLKSSIVTVSRAAIDTPLYVHAANELILLNCAINRPFQFAYQFSHEFGHLMAQAQSRLLQSGRHDWIKEAICGAYSVYAIRRMAAEGPMLLRDGAHSYLETCIQAEYYSQRHVDKTWFAEHREEIVTANNLNDRIKLISGMIADELHRGEFVNDNVSLINVPLNEDVRTYLRDWRANCHQYKCVPSILQNWFDLA